jgi:hypothetical protein
MSYTPDYEELWSEACRERDFAIGAAKFNDDARRRFEAALTEAVEARNHDRKLLRASLRFGDAARSALLDAGLLTEELAVMFGKVVVLAATGHPAPEGEADGR